MAPERLGSGVSNGPHGPWNVGPHIRPRPNWEKKFSKAKKIKNHHEKGHDPKSMVGPIGPKIHISRNFQGQWGQDPLEDFEREFQSRQEGPNIKLAHSQWDI
ncbi:hypothetical protein O181_060236 [Austropuccinia psidii MF-1]|uniref:Uncharacterized protein n=1 Tax=Austropuccinia psidii MF-1 TaxID=1389203 RepID=A0A9Q3EKJ3_9BASI|nr:hypothetical protein [Austropuccinia psidii MF-1]